MPIAPPVPGTPPIPAPWIPASGPPVPGEEPTRWGPTWDDIISGVRRGVGVDSQTRTDTQSKEGDCAQTKDDSECEQCKLGSGKIVTPAARYVVKENIVNYVYQLYVANMFAGPEHFTMMAASKSGGGNPVTGWLPVFKLVEDFFSAAVMRSITEWEYGGVEFDGFWRSKCTVIETKANYKKQVNPNGSPKFYLAWEVEKWGAQYRKQQARVEAAGAPARLEWHFMQNEVKVCAEQYAGLPTTQTFHTRLPEMRK